jgi:hypothetical protein
LGRYQSLFLSWRRASCEVLPDLRAGFGVS